MVKLSILAVIFKKVVPFLGQIVSGLFTGVGFFYRTFLRPFWFSSNKPYLIAPYFYVFIGMIAFFIAIGGFMYLCYAAAFPGIKTPEIILPTLAGVIATLMATNTLMINVYNSGKKSSETESSQPVGDTNAGV